LYEPYLKSNIIKENKMPVGYPKNPAAHAEKMAALAQKRAAAKLANGSAKRIQKRASKPRKLVDYSLQEKYDGAMQTIVDLEADLEKLQDLYDRQQKKVGDLQDTANDLRMHVFTVLDLVANQK
jgi:hypothetical protein